MRAITIVAASIIAGLGIPLTLLTLFLMPFKLSHLIPGILAAVLLGSAMIAGGGGGLWFLRLAWLVLFVALFWSDPPMGLFEGGVITLPLALLILVGFVSSLFARRARPDKEIAAEHG